MVLQKKAAWAEQLGGLSADQVESMYGSVDQLIREVLYRGLRGSAIGQVFPSGFHADLKGLLTKLLGAHVAEWAEQSISSQVSPPKLVDFDWRVDQKRSSNHLARMSVPSVMVEMKVSKKNLLF